MVASRVEINWYAAARLPMKLPVQTQPFVYVVQTEATRIQVIPIFDTTQPGEFLSIVGIVLYLDIVTLPRGSLKK